MDNSPRQNIFRRVAKFLRNFRNLQNRFSSCARALSPLPPFLFPYFIHLSISFSPLPVSAVSLFARTFLSLPLPFFFLSLSILTLFSSPFFSPPPSSLSLFFPYLRSSSFWLSPWSLNYLVRSQSKKERGVVVQARLTMMISLSRWTVVFVFSRHVLHCLCLYT
jgi:hypothetical protein